jgi:hypothetical protein
MKRKAPKSRYTASVPFPFVLIIRRAWVRSSFWTPLLEMPARLHGYHHTPLLHLQRRGFMVRVKLRRMASQSVRSSCVELHLRPPLHVSFLWSSACLLRACANHSNTNACACYCGGLYSLVEIYCKMYPKLLKEILTSFFSESEWGIHEENIV